MTNRVADLTRMAGSLAREGRWREAEDSWREVLQLEPMNVDALASLGVHAINRSDLALAAQFLERALAISPANFLAFQALVSVYRRTSDMAAERMIAERALAADAYFLPALLARASIQEREGRPAQAAQTYLNALKIAPPEEHWPSTLHDQLLHGKRVSTSHAERLGAHLEERLCDLQVKLSPQQQERWCEARSVMAGLSKPYHVSCNRLYVPRLPAIPFYDSSQFPWAPALESRAHAIRDELLGVLTSQAKDLRPYIAYRPGDPVNQWKELNHSPRWSTYDLYLTGSPVQEHLTTCPVTATALAAVDLAHIPGNCPNAMFSILAPRTRIPPHHGETNARLVAHVPLIVPDGCWLRVGFEKRKWEVGKVLIFDDTIEHEAVNDSDEPRVVLIFDVWNPLLSLTEREMVREMTDAARSFAG